MDVFIDINISDIIYTVFCLHLCLCTTCTQYPWSPGQSDRALGIAVTNGHHHAVLRNEPRSSGRTAPNPSHLSGSAFPDFK